MPKNANDFCDCQSGLRARRCCAISEVDLAGPVPDWVPAEAERAAMALQNGDTGSARELCLAILDVAPGHTGALAMLAQHLQGSGQIDASINLLARILRLTPDNLPAVQQLAGLLLKAGRLPEAEFQARNAVRLAPDNATSHALLAMILTTGHCPHIGEFHYRQALDLADPDGITMANLAWNLKLQGRIDEARALYRQSVSLAPSIHLTWLGWARTEEAGRELEDASRFLTRGRRLVPDHPTGSFEATLLARRGEPQAALAVLEEAGRRPAGPTSDELFEKARILDRQGCSDEAFAAMLQGKALVREAGNHYAEGEAADLTTRLTRFFTAPRLHRLPRPETRATGAQPIFIVGAPRSGTTLVEQILSSHPAIAAGDELPVLSQLTVALPRILGSPLAYPEALSELWMGDQQDGLDCLRDEYLRQARKLVPIEAGNRLFTDKMPFNEMHLGLIALMFPDAPVVHVLRHPLDVVLSMMSVDLTHGFHCASELATAARHCLRMIDLVSHYRQQMPLRYLPVRYEDLLNEFEPNVRRLLAFLELSFDQRCLQFEENRRYARTASYAQVTEKLNTRSLYRYRAYMRHLEPVIPLMEPAICNLGYQI
ncbi:tetratricopeptide repeat-containing sulfotransferase family protein [Azospirillum sp. SYSU D00513]|uniref:tetratricopeptide repeat-containing sulfotransferase family protein n=1 Tax=Azospirillum sp. SYSU D00513 TaxID=2812561 RepID=UPI001A96B538|nr:tetratricopeptide repeat-containing sulfotransferase family protein [Azospirillum sp. SYSU D00513]